MGEKRRSCRQFRPGKGRRVRARGGRRQRRREADRQAKARRRAALEPIRPVGAHAGTAAECGGGWVGEAAPSAWRAAPSSLPSSSPPRHATPPSLSPLPLRAPTPAVTAQSPAARALRSAPTPRPACPPGLSLPPPHAPPAPFALRTRARHTATFPGRRRPPPFNHHLPARHPPAPLSLPAGSPPPTPHSPQAHRASPPFFPLPASQAGDTEARGAGMRALTGSTVAILDRSDRTSAEGEGRGKKAEGG